MMDLAGDRMKLFTGIVLICLWLPGTATPLTAASDERAGIERVISALTDPRTDKAAKRALFTADAGTEIDHLKELQDPGASTPWSERSIPWLVVRSIRWIAPDVALVDALNTQYGMNGVTKVPVLVVLKRQDQKWR